MKYWSLFLILICACAGKVFAQTLDYASKKEKIYIQTSHVFFKPGEEVFFKLYLVNAQNNTPSSVSNTVHVDVLNPAGNVVTKLTYRVTNGYTEGSYAFGPTAAGGIYKLRAYTAWMKNETDSTFFTKELTVQHVISPRILMKLDFPEKGYGPGGMVTAHFSARSLADKPLANQIFEYTVSLAGQAAQPVTLQTDAAGKAVIQFHLPADLNTTDGLLNIKVQYDAYVEAISRSIPITLNKVQLQLMPEGGTLVAGLPANVAFKAVNEFGKPVDVKGELRDGSGETVTTLQSFHGGMGRFTFTPRQGNTYHVVLTSPANITHRYPLSRAVREGLALQLTQDNGRLLMHLHATQQADVKVTGYTKEHLYYTQNIHLKRGAQTLSIDPAAFPAGITRFTVSQANGLPLAERIIFLNPGKMLQVKMTPDKAQYMPREKVTIKMKTLDNQGKPVPSNFSLAVLDDKLWTFADDRQDHLISWLMMSSELKGKIEEPQFYFRKDETKALSALDLLMLTHGYRYFDFLPAVKEGNKLQFLPDVQNIITGKVVNGRDEPVRARVWVIMTDNIAMQLETGDDGTFFFPGLQPDGNYMVVAQSLQKKERIRLVIPESGPARYGNAAVLAPPPLPAQAPPAAQGDRLLEEVVVVGFDAQKKRNVTGAVTVITGRELNAASVNNALAGSVSGVNVVQRANPAQDPGVQVRGTSSVAGDNKPLMIVDGIPTEWTGNNLDPADVTSIYIVKGPAATAIYGSLGAQGVIIVETRKNSESRLRWTHAPKVFFASREVHLKGPRLTPVRRFYAPQYATTETAERTDFRETIYWNPVVQTDKNGEASVSFYNSDATTTFRAIAEGIGYNGLPGRAETTYAVRPLLSVDAKIPPYLTVGDNARIPLHIKNNDTRPLHAAVKVEFAESVKAGIFNKNISIAPGGATVLHIPVTATSPVAGSLRFTVSSAQHTETVSLPVTVVHKGFPLVETFAGNRTAHHPFNIHKMVPGSLRYELKVFNNPEGQLLDGVASMLREPYGCFEQTSSATYPNIFILKYLREAGRSNPDTERKAMDYLEKGYKRLISFETTAGGFEWFGRTPPHEALTAYGLMEFTDMNEFIEVDKQLLKRTKNFLLGRRDGKGGFLLSATGYDRFATVPNKIANLYIVYAFSHAGYGAEVTREYEHALADVLQGNDAYQLSMMALTAANMHRQADFARLMNILRGLYRQKNFKAATSVVNSKATSLKVETSALYLLALAREKEPDLPLMAELMTDIMNSKSYFGYSSTQATVLALSAVIAYAKVFGKAAAETDIRFLLNNREVTPGIIPVTETRSANNFQVKYSGAENRVPYNMEVSYYTFTPPGSPLAELRLHTALAKRQVKTGETVRMEIAVTNEKAVLQGMSIAKIGIPAGLSAQPWQLKELTEKNEAAYYEIFDNCLVLYWMGFAPNETKTLRLDLKADIPGTYKAKASNAGLYYMPEHKHWNEGLEAEVLP